MSPKKGSSKVWWLALGSVVLAVALFIGVWQFLSPANRKKIPVAYSDFLAEVHAGKVDEIKIKDREIIYRLRATERDKSVVKETVGPVPDQALIDSLKPTDPSVPPPKIYFEKD